MDPRWLAILAMESRPVRAAWSWSEPRPMSELRLLRDLRWPAVELESERGTWKEPRRGMKALRGRLLLVMEPWRLSGCQRWIWKMCMYKLSILSHQDYTFVVHMYFMNTTCVTIQSSVSSRNSCRGEGRGKTEFKILQGQWLITSNLPW